MHDTLLWCTEVYKGRGVPWFLDHQAARMESRRPRSSIRLRTLTAILVSTSCAGRLWERKVSTGTAGEGFRQAAERMLWK